MSAHRRIDLFSSTTILLLALPVFIFGCSRGYREDLDYDYKVKQEWQIEEFNGLVVQFESVFWEPDDTVSLRKMIVDDSICVGRDVLEIGTGTGLISVVCALHGADKVVATDINPAAIANAKYNAAMLAEEMPIEVRTVSTKSPSAFSVIKPGEKFHLIISNPPWEDGEIKQPADHAFYDPDFELMDTLLDGLPSHLHTGGRCLIAYGHVPAIKRLLDETERRGLVCKVLDDRKLDELPEDFLPGMLVEIRVPNELKQGEKVAPIRTDGDKSVGSNLDAEAVLDDRGVDSTAPVIQGRDSAPNGEK